jgi:hypothetical protein
VYFVRQESCRVLSFRALAVTLPGRALRAGACFSSWLAGAPVYNASCRLLPTSGGIPMSLPRDRRDCRACPRTIAAASGLVCDGSPIWTSWRWELDTAVGLFLCQDQCDAVPAMLDTSEEIPAAGNRRMRRWAWSSALRHSIRNRDGADWR